MATATDYIACYWIGTYKGTSSLDPAIVTCMYAAFQQTVL
jgi:hypothetical protein